MTTRWMPVLGIECPSSWLVPIVIETWNAEKSESYIYVCLGLLKSAHQRILIDKELHDQRVVDDILMTAEDSSDDRDNLSSMHLFVGKRWWKAIASRAPWNRISVCSYTCPETTKAEHEKTLKRICKILVRNINLAKDGSRNVECLYEVLKFVSEDPRYIFGKCGGSLYWLVLLLRTNILAQTESQHASYQYFERQPHTSSVDLHLLYQPKQCVFNFYYYSMYEHGDASDIFQTDSNFQCVRFELQKTSDLFASASAAQWLNHMHMEHKPEIDSFETFLESGLDDVAPSIDVRGHSLSRSTSPRMGSSLSRSASTPRETSPRSLFQGGRSEKPFLEAVSGRRS